jgi:membrane protease YdiL (CAAX protease family)
LIKRVIKRPWGWLSCKSADCKIIKGEIEMKSTVRLLLAIIMGACIYYLAVYVIPSLSLFEGLLKSSWISNGDITQITLLVISLILIYIFSKGNLSTYGFKSIKIKQLIKPVLISIPTVFLLMVMAGLVIGISGSIPEGGNATMKGGMLKTIISVWLIASTCEEIFYRGLILSFLASLKKYGFKLFRSHISVPVTVSALGFGLGHLCLLNRMNSVIVINLVILAIALGFIAGYYREKTGSLIPAIAAHMTFNIVGFMIPELLMK